MSWADEEYGDKLKVVKCETDPNPQLVRYTCSASTCAPWVILLSSSPCVRCVLPCVYYAASWKRKKAFVSLRMLRLTGRKVWGIRPANFDFVQRWREGRRQPLGGSNQQGQAWNSLDKVWNWQVGPTLCRRTLHCFAALLDMLVYWQRAQLQLLWHPVS